MNCQFCDASENFIKMYIINGFSVCRDCRNNKAYEEDEEIEK